LLGEATYPEVTVGKEIFIKSNILTGYFMIIARANKIIIIKMNFLGENITYHKQSFMWDFTFNNTQLEYC
jgi:hypothetical protein